MHASQAMGWPPTSTSSASPPRPLTTRSHAQLAWTAQFGCSDTCYSCWTRTQIRANHNGPRASSTDAHLVRVAQPHSDPRPHRHRSARRSVQARTITLSQRLPQHHTHQTALRRHPLDQNMPPTASSSSTLFLAPSRRQTFHKSRKAASTKHLNWPYPLSGAAAKSSSIHPDRLVEAGFYSTPIDDDPTVTTCFACGVVVGMWEEGEDALFRHEAAAEEAGIRCPFATVRRHGWGEEGVDAPGRERESWDECWGEEGEWHPRGERMNEARRGTFDVGWPYDDDGDGVPTRDEIAAAGWSFRPGPTAESADQCACIYCGRTVEGWEAGDDPIALHKRKVGLRCPFFLADDPKPKSTSTPASTSTSASSKSKRGKKASTAPSTASDAAASLKKSTRGRVPKVVEQEEPVEDDAPAATETTEESEPVKLPTRQSARKGKTAAKGKAKKSKVASTPAQSDVEEELEREEEEVVEEPAPVAKKSTRSRAASNASTTSSAMPPPRAAALSRSVRGRKPVDESDVEVAAAPKLKKSTRGKKAPEPEPEPEAEVEQELEQEEADESIAQLAAIANAALELQDAEVGVEEVKEKPKPAKGKKAAAASKSKTLAAKKQKEEVEQVEDVEMQQEEQERAEEQRLTKPRSKEAAPPVVAAVPSAASTSATAAAPARSPLSPTVSPTSPSRPIRALPSKVHASKSPSTAAVKAPTPPRPASVVPPAPVLTPAPASPAPISTKPASASPAVDPTRPWTPPSNAFASDLLSLLPPPTDSELSTLTVGAWYTLCAQRIQDRFEAETDELRRGLEARIAAGRERLKELCEEAKEREVREEAEENRRRKEKAREKKLAAAAAAGAGGRTAVKAGGGSARKLR
ncbi:hypothetical protein BJY59DRAFT_726790 [Rhodotorula toruloides]